MWLGAATKEEERVSQLQEAALNPHPPQPNAGTVQSLGAPLAMCQGAYAALAPGSPLPVMAVMVAGSLSRLPARLVMLIW